VGFGIDLYKFWVTPSTEEKRQGALLLCSDGLYSLVSEPDLATIIGTYSPLEACTKLIELARERGGYDNITAIVIPLAGELRDEQAPPARAPEDAVTPSVLKPSAHRQKKRRAPLSSHLGLLGIVGVVSMALTVLGFLFFAILRD
jgi:serine/threonine protein phosphatase PrpC